MKYFYTLYRFDKPNTPTSWFYFLISASTCPAAQFHAKSMHLIASHTSYSRRCLTVCARTVLPITVSHLGVCVIASCNFTLRIRFPKWDKEKTWPRVAAVQKITETAGVIGWTPAPWEYIVAPKSYCTMKCHSTLATRGITLPWK